MALRFDFAMNNESCSTRSIKKLNQIKKIISDNKKN